MYEAVVRRLRKMIKAHKEIYGGSTEESVAIEQAADAIEALSAHYCPHMIRNVHDRGDDSLCGVLVREVPKEET